MNKDNNKIKTKNLKENLNIAWSFKILGLSFILSVAFSIISDMVLTHTSFIISIIMILLFMAIGVVSDMIGVAVTSCNKTNQLDKIKDEKTKKISIDLVNNSDKISVICCDIIGDICSILSGACGASIVYKLIMFGSSAHNDIIISSCVSGLIACLTIFLKSLEKRLAVTKSDKILVSLARCIKRIKK